MRDEEMASQDDVTLTKSVNRDSDEMAPPLPPSSSRLVPPPSSSQLGVLTERETVSSDKLTKSLRKRQTRAEGLVSIPRAALMMFVYAEMVSGCAALVYCTRPCVQ